MRFIETVSCFHSVPQMSLVLFFSHLLTYYKLNNLNTSPLFGTPFLIEQTLEITVLLLPELRPQSSNEY